MTELLAERVVRWVRETPDAPAIVDADGVTTYRELGEMARSIADAVGGARRIALLPVSDAGSIAVAVGAMLTGTSIVLLHRHLMLEEMRHALTLTQPTHVVASTSVHRRLARLGVSTPVTPAQLAAMPGAASAAVPSDELLVGLTSGTTGAPKLFVRNQMSWAATLDRSDEVFTVDGSSRVWTPGVLDHTHFLYGALHALTRGAQVDLRSVGVPDAAPTHIYTVPAIASDIAAGQQLPSVREVMSSSSSWASAARQRLSAVIPNARVWHFYGASELSFVALDTSGESAGRPFRGVDIDIRDGIVHVRSDMLFDGYLGPDGTYGGPEDGWFSVGDRGSLRGGQLFLDGRVSDTIVRGGLKVEPAQVESALMACGGVLDAACVGMPDARMGQIPIAVIVATEPGPTDREIRHTLRSLLPSPAMPTRIVRLDSLPRSPRGKVDRSALLGAITAHAGRGTPGGEPEQ